MKRGREHAKGCEMARGGALFSFRCFRGAGTFFVAVLRLRRSFQPGQSPSAAQNEARDAELSTSAFRAPGKGAVERDLTLTVDDNAEHLTVSQCYEHLERIDELISKNGEKPRYMDSRRFFERQLQWCLRRREAEHPSYGE